MIGMQRKHALWVCLILLPACARAGDECASLTNTAVGAALGDPTETYNLAVAFYTGKCVEKNYGRAAVLWEKAAAKGVISAKNNLGYLLSQGLGVREDDARAVAFWREAAIAGHAESQVHLGTAMFDGIGVPQDQVTGLAWVLRGVDSSTRYPDIGGGAEVLRMAQKEKARMLATAPLLLDAATERSASLELKVQGN